MKKIFSFLLMATLLSGCTAGTDEQVTNEKLQVAASIYPWAFFAEQIGGDLVAVETLVPVGLEPHDYDPAPNDLKSLYDADIFIYNGAALEPWAEDIEFELREEDVQLFAAADYVELLPLLEGADHEEHEEEEHEEEEHEEEEHEEEEHEEEEHEEEEHEEEEHEEEEHEEEEHEEEEHEEEEHEEEHSFIPSASAHETDEEHAEYDPHFWLDPVRVRIVVQSMANSFASLDSENADVYLANAKVLMNTLDKINEDFTADLALCSGKEFVTSHAAFAYLADRYELEMIPISGISHEDEPTIKELEEISKTVEEHGLNTIYTETLVDSSFAITISTGTGAQLLVLNPIEGLTNEDVAAGENYFTIFEKNLESLKVGLSCEE